MKQVDRLVIYLKDSQKYSDVFEDDVENGISVSFEVKDSILSVKKEASMDDGEYIERDTVCYPMENVKSFNYKEYDTPVEDDTEDEQDRPVEKIEVKAKSAEDLSGCPGLPSPAPTPSTIDQLRVMPISVVILISLSVTVLYQLIMH